MFGTQLVSMTNLVKSTNIAKSQKYAIIYFMIILGKMNFEITLIDDSTVTEFDFVVQIPVKYVSFPTETYVSLFTLITFVLYVLLFDLFFTMLAPETTESFVCTVDEEYHVMFDLILKEVCLIVFSCNCPLPLILCLLCASSLISLLLLFFCVCLI